MLKIFTGFITILIILLFNTETKANVAQPGLWNAGGMGNFSLLYPEDSISYKKFRWWMKRFPFICIKVLQ